MPHPDFSRIHDNSPCPARNHWKNHRTDCLPDFSAHHMQSRKSHRVFALFAILLALFLFTFADASMRRAGSTDTLVANGRLVAQLGLTDLCLFTEARYTRHPSQADLQSAFQDHPFALEHFPSGSLLPPPRNLTAAYENLDRKTKSAD